MSKTLVVNKAQMKTICQDWLNEKYFKQEILVNNVSVDHADTFTITFDEVTEVQMTESHLRYEQEA